MFKDRKIEMKLVKDEAQDGMDEYRPTPRDPYFELRMLVEENIKNVVAAVVLIKATTTIFNALEHIVVTKIR